MSYVMGELLDSSDEAGISTARFAERVRSYLSALGGKVDLWEIGNEVNGNWTGPYPVVSAKLTAVYKEVNAAGGLDQVFWAAARPVPARAPRLRRDRHERPATSRTIRRATSLMRYYYGLPIRLPYFADGYFWQYYAEDGVPYTSRPLWSAMRSAFEAEARANYRGF